MSDINMTGEVKEINLLDMMGGAVGERVSYELSKIMRNCKDLNTEPKKARTLTIEFSITPTETRDSAAIRVSVKSKLVPVKVPNPVELAPFRTFTEVEQPTSPFVFRVRRDGDAIMAALFAADADAWKNEAICRIRDYFDMELPDEYKDDVIILA